MLEQVAKWESDIRCVRLQSDHFFDVIPVGTKLHEIPLSRKNIISGAGCNCILFNKLQSIIELLKQSANLDSALYYIQTIL